MSKPFPVLVGASTDPGQQKVNEDAFYIFENRISPKNPLLLEGLYAVADADSPDAHGDAASRLALTTIAQKMEPILGHEEGSLLRILQEGIEEAHRRLQELARHENWRNIRVSLACVLLIGTHLIYTSAGSCSIFLLRDDELRELSHTAPLVQGQEVLSPALGEEGFRTDVFEVRLREGDSLLLATDGLVERVRYRDLAEVLHWSLSPQAAGDRLLSLAVRAGSRENMTALVLDIQPVRHGNSNWWKIVLGLLAVLVVGFAITFILLQRRGSPPETPASPSSSSEASSESLSARYIFISGLQDPYALLQVEDIFYVLDKGQKKVLAYTSNGKPVESFDGSLKEAEAPCDLVEGPTVLFVLDAAGKIFAVSVPDGAVETVEIDMGENGSLSSPRAIAFDGSYYYIADRGNDRIVYLDRNFRYAGEYGGLAEGKPVLEKPNGLAVDDAGNLYVSLKDAHQVVKLDPNGLVIARAGSEATSIGIYDGPADLGLTANQQQVLAPEMSLDKVLVYDAELNLQYKVGREQLPGANFRDPKCVFVSGQALFVAGGSSEDGQGTVWRIPWNLVLGAP
ncbi:MAG: protein phosphatase 2C domain-containing protein [bacterium]